MDISYFGFNSQCQVYWVGLNSTEKYSNVNKRYPITSLMTIGPVFSPLCHLLLKSWRVLWNKIPSANSQHQQQKKLSLCGMVYISSSYIFNRRNTQFYYSGINRFTVVSGLGLELTDCSRFISKLNEFILVTNFGHSTYDSLEAMKQSGQDDSIWKHVQI